MSAQKHIINIFKQSCREIGFRFHQISPTKFLAMTGGHHGKWAIFCYLNDTSLTFYFILPVSIPPAKRPPVMEYLTRANYGLVVGNFELDLDDGEVRYKTSLDVMDGKLTTAMVGILLAVNCHMADRYLKGLLQLVVTDATPADVIQAAEGTGDAEDLRALLDDVAVELDRLPTPDDN